MGQEKQVAKRKISRSAGKAGVKKNKAGDRYWDYIFSLVLFMIAVAVLFSAYQYYNRVSQAITVKLVLIDPVKIANAQKRVIGDIVMTGDADRALTLRNFGKTINMAIKKYAGPGAVVLVKQSVVFDGQGLDDITDDVIMEIGGDIDSPTVDLTKSWDYVPTSQSIMPNIRESEFVSEAIAEKLKRDRMKNEDKERFSVLP